eukprot:scaffold402_cov311-Prasinococcus_capsulatus_cf.AAC.2
MRTKAQGLSRLPAPWGGPYRAAQAAGEGARARRGRGRHVPAAFAGLAPPALAEGPRGSPRVVRGGAQPVTATQSVRARPPCSARTWVGEPAVAPRQAKMLLLLLLLIRPMGAVGSVRSSARAHGVWVEGACAVTSAKALT